MRFILRRAGFYLAAAIIAIIINFVIPRLMTGNPEDVMFARFQGQLEPEAMEAMLEAFGFVDGPIHEQFFTYVGSLAQGDLGISVMRFPTPVSQVIGISLGWTLRLVGVATLISFGVGVTLGIFAAWRRGGFVDSVMLPLTTILRAIPYFWIALIALYFLAFQFGWFPTSGSAPRDVPKDWGDPDYIFGVVEHALLPAITIIITSIGTWMLGMRNNMIGVLSEDYITMAEAKGLDDHRVMFQYAARNAILPSLTGFAMSLGFVLSGALVTEIVFAYPGVGFTLLSAVNARDYPTMQGIFIMITIAVLIANLIADLAYVLLDPRARAN
jgi:peptide/nickel transport system permease protein